MPVVVQFVNGDVKTYPHGGRCSPERFLDCRVEAEPGETRGGRP